MSSSETKPAATATGSPARINSAASRSASSLALVAASSKRFSSDFARAALSILLLIRSKLQAQHFPVAASIAF